MGNDLGTVLVESRGGYLPQFSSAYPQVAVRPYRQRPCSSDRNPDCMLSVETSHGAIAKRYPKEAVLRLYSVGDDVGGESFVIRKTLLEVAAKWLAGIERVGNVRHEEQD